jgi:hypothetical protein
MVLVQIRNVIRLRPLKRTNSFIESMSRSKNDENGYEEGDFRHSKTCTIHISCFPYAGDLSSFPTKCSGFLVLTIQQMN